MEHIELVRSTVSYITVTANRKKYNLQMIALKKYLNLIPIGDIENELIKTVERFSLDNELILCKDFFLKNDSFTPRNSIVISPVYYIYYTHLVFKIFDKSFFCEEDKVCFSRTKIKSFYSGELIYTDQKDIIEKCATFDRSYNLFKMEREKLENKYIYKFDVQNFFDSISISNLILKLKMSFPGNEDVIELERFFSICNMHTLPQLHYSIASSLLSQFYLNDFDNILEVFLYKNNQYLIRFVDDMYIYQDYPFVERDLNNLKDLICTLLWKDNLTVNLNKSRLVKPDEFEEMFKLTGGSNYEEELEFVTEKFIEDEASQLVTNPMFIEFFNELNDLYLNQGTDITLYQKKLSDLSSDDHSKIFNNIIYGEKWRNLDDEVLYKLIKNWRYVFFNPNQFTVLFVKVNRYLENKRKEEYPFVRELLNHFHQVNEPSIREIITVITYLNQNRNKNKDILMKISYLSPEYTKYLKKYT